MTMEPLVIETRMTKEDFVKVSQYLLRRLLLRPWTLVFLVVGVMLLFVRMWTNGISAGVFGLLLAGTVVMIVTYRMRKQFEQAYERNFRNKETLVYTFRADGFRLEGATFHADIAWAQVHRVQWWGDFLLIFVEKHKAHLLHRRFLRPGQEEHLTALLDHAKPGWRN